jgi:8-oxo-dGTP pyrophosphatase MutT (NUDIX family)
VRTLQEAIMVVYRRPGPEFLVLLRSPEDHGYWHLVAGGIEEGEQPAAAALRELMEETALDEPVRFEELRIDLGYRRPRSDLRVKLYAYSVEVPADWEPTLNEEHVDYRWLPEDGARALLAYPEPREAIEAVARQLAEESG